MYKVKEVAELAGVTVRLLHHYDKIGLLNPSHKSESGYRLYDEGDIGLLQQILLYKELDFSLQDIKEIVESQAFDKKEALVKHRSLLQVKMKRLQRIIDAVEDTLDQMEADGPHEPATILTAMDNKEYETMKNQYAKEVEERWGGTEAFRQSQERTKKYNKEDWDRILGRQDGILADLAGLMDQPVDNPKVQVLVAAYRDHITDNFYDCTLEIYRGLGELFVNDPRYGENMDKHGEGFTAFFSKAIAYYCDHAQ